MEFQADFTGPSSADYDNVTSLNRGFLALLRRDPRARGCLDGLRRELAERLVGLTPVQAERLAVAPFLLMSFRERDDRFWEAAFSRHVNRDLFAGPPAASDDPGCLISAGLGFLWQLARHNAYSARLICGASIHWCEQLTELPFLQLHSVAELGYELLTLRCASDGELWSKLLTSGTSREQQVRRAAHITGLQTVLTRSSMPARQWAAAACAARAPSLRVAEDAEP